MTRTKRLPPCGCAQGRLQANEAEVGPRRVKLGYPQGPPFQRSFFKNSSASLPLCPGGTIFSASSSNSKRCFAFSDSQMSAVISARRVSILASREKNTALRNPGMAEAHRVARACFTEPRAAKTIVPRKIEPASMAKNRAIQCSRVAIGVSRLRSFSTIEIAFSMTCRVVRDDSSGDSLDFTRSASCSANSSNSDGPSAADGSIRIHPAARGRLGEAAAACRESGANWRDGASWETEVRSAASATAELNDEASPASAG